MVKWKVWTLLQNIKKESKRINIGEEKVEEVEEFRYLQRIWDTQQRMAQGKQAVTIRQSTKILLCDCLILSLLNYGYCLYGTCSTAIPGATK